MHIIETAISLLSTGWKLKSASTILLPKKTAANANVMFSYKPFYLNSGATLIICSFTSIFNYKKNQLCR